MNTRQEMDHRIRDAVVPGLITLTLIGLWAHLSHGLSFWVTFIPGIVIAYAAYLLTSYRKMPEARDVLPIYLAGVAWQFLHFSEEFATKFYIHWPVDVFHSTPMGTTEFVLVNMLSYAVFLAGAVALIYRFKPLMLVVWFFAVMGEVGNVIGHLVYPLVTHETYFPGLYTSLAYLVLGPMLIARLVRGSRRPTAEAETPSDVDGGAMPAARRAA